MIQEICDLLLPLYYRVSFEIWNCELRIKGSSLVVDFEMHVPLTGHRLSTEPRMTLLKVSAWDRETHSVVFHRETDVQLMAPVEVLTGWLQLAERAVSESNRKREAANA